MSHATYNRSYSLLVLYHPGPYIVSISYYSWRDFITLVYHVFVLQIKWTKEENCFIWDGVLPEDVELAREHA